MCYVLQHACMNALRLSVHPLPFLPPSPFVSIPRSLCHVRHAQSRFAWCSHDGRHCAVHVHGPHRWLQWCSHVPDTQGHPLEASRHPHGHPLPRSGVWCGVCSQLLHLGQALFWSCESVEETCSEAALWHVVACVCWGGGGGDSESGVGFELCIYVRTVCIVVVLYMQRCNDIVELS